MRPTNATDHEEERLKPGATAGKTRPEPASTPKKNDAALPGSPNADLRGARRDRKPRGMST
jgi:hypothetical protein